MLSDLKNVGSSKNVMSSSSSVVKTPSKMEREVLSILLTQGSKTPARIGDEMRRDRTEVRSVLKSLRKSGKADCVGEDEENEDDDESVWFLTTGYLNDLLSRKSSRGVQSQGSLLEEEEVDVDFEEDDIDVFDDGDVEVDVVEEDDDGVIEVSGEEDGDIEVQDDDDDDRTDNMIVKVSKTQRRRKIIDSSSEDESEEVPRHSTHTKKTKRRRRIIDSSSSEDEFEETPRHSIHTKKTKRRIIDSSSEDEASERSKKPYESEEEEEFEFNTSSSSSSSPSLLQLSNDLAARTKSLGGFIVSDDDFSEDDDSYIKDTDDDDDDSFPVKIANELDIHPKIYSRLYKHQIEGLEWMWKLWNRSQDAGGILADDMGLGKTVRSIFSRKYSDVNSINVFKHQPQVQAATFISAMIKAKHVKRALVVVPVAVMPQWLESLREWGRGKLVLWLFHGSSVKRRNRALRMASTHGGVCVTTYSMIRLHVDKFIKDTTWDVLICDEAHIIKNAHSKTSKAMRKIDSRHRYLLTGMFFFFFFVRRKTRRTDN